MRIVTRHEAVQVLGPYRSGQRLILDRRWNTLRPRDDEDHPQAFWKDKAGNWWLRAVLEAQRGRGPLVMNQATGWGARGALGGKSSGGTTMIWGNSSVTNATPAQGTVVYGTTTNFSFGVNGSASGLRFIPAVAETLTGFYTYFTVTPTNNIKYALYSSLGALGAPVTQVIALTAFTKPASNAWANVGGLNQALTAGTPYWFFTADDAATSQTTGATVLRNVTQTGTASTTMHLAAASTANGWTTTTIQSLPPSLVLVMQSGRNIGASVATVTAPALDNNEKGLNIASTVLVAPVSVFGAIYGANAANISQADIYNAATNPANNGDVAHWTGAIASTAAAVTGFIGTPATLQAGSAYRAVFGSGGGGTFARPHQLNIGTGSDATLQGQLPIDASWAGANGVTNWANDLASTTAFASVLVDDLVAVSGAIASRQGY